jgi:hypothetical protein
MPSTQINTASDGTWTVDAPDGVTVTPTTDTTGIATALKISVDYNYTDFTNPATGSILGITFAGSKANSATSPSTAAQFGLRIPFELDITNDLGVPIKGYSVYLANENLLNMPPPVPDTTDAHPDNYAHFHSVTPTTFVDAATGMPNATLTLYDPNFGPGAFGPAGNNPAPDFISADGTIAPGVTEKAAGLILHSEDLPDGTGGSFTLALFPQDTIGEPVPPTSPRPGLPPGVTTIADHQADGNCYILDGASDSVADLPVLSFLNDTTNKLSSVFVGDPSSTVPPVGAGYGGMVLGVNAHVKIAHGLTVSNGTLNVDEAPSSVLELNGSSRLEHNGTLTVGSFSNQGSMKLDHNATLTLDVIGSNRLNLAGVKVTGSGTIVNAGESDITRVGSVGKHVTIAVQNGELDIDRPGVFDGTIGPSTGTGQAIGLFGEVRLFQAMNAASATFDTSTGFLDVLNSSGQDLAHLHFGGDASDLVLSKVSGQNYLSIVDQPGRTGDVPISYT